MKCLTGYKIHKSTISKKAMLGWNCCIFALALFCLTLALKMDIIGYNLSGRLEKQ